MGKERQMVETKLTLVTTTRASRACPCIYPSEHARRILEEWVAGGLWSPDILWLNPAITYLKGGVEGRVMEQKESLWKTENHRRTWIFVLLLDKLLPGLMVG